MLLHVGLFDTNTWGLPRRSSPTCEHSDTTCHRSPILFLGHGERSVKGFRHSSVPLFLGVLVYEGSNHWFFARKQDIDRVHPSTLQGDQAEQRLRVQAMAMNLEVRAQGEEPPEYCKFPFECPDLERL